MKLAHIVSSISLVLFFSGTVYSSKNSEAYDFMSSFIDALSLVDWAESYMDVNKIKAEDPSGFSVEYMTNLIVSNSKLDEAIAEIKPFIKSKNEHISGVAEVTGAIAMSLQDANKRTIKEMETILKGEMANDGDVNINIAKTNAQTKLSFQNLMKVSFMSFYIITQPTGTPKGNIPFNLSDIERKHLLQRIDQKFKDNIERYYTLKQSLDEDKKYSVITLSVLYIKQLLAIDTFEQYEEMRKTVWNPPSKPAEAIP
jgi:hypothetical protein